MRRWIAVFVGIAIVAGTVQPAAAVEVCGDYVIIGARGTDDTFDTEFEAGMGAEVFQFARKMQEILQATGSEDVELVGVDYAARLMHPYWTDRPELQQYFASVQEGADFVVDEVLSKFANCGDDTKFILSGFSQGSDVMRTAVRDLGSAGTEDELEQIAGVVVFGDVYFDPEDTAVADGPFNPQRWGLLGPTDRWSDLTDAPVISVCRDHDYFCQARTHIKVGDVEGPLYWDSGYVYDWNDKHFDGNDFGEHESYDDMNHGLKAARQLGELLGVHYTLDDGWGAADPVDVAIVVDSTGNADGAVSELQSRASEFVHLVTDNVEDSRVAVVDYKSGGSITETNPYAVDVKSEFSADPEDAIDAITEIEQGGRSTGAIYSAVETIDDLAWREGVRKITLTLAGSRACASAAICVEESGSGEPYPDPAVRNRPLFLRAAGVYTRDNLYFLENAGWSAIMEEPWISRPGEYGTSDEYIVEELKRVFELALTTVEDPIAGNEQAVVGESGTFNAATVVPYFADSPDVNLQWAVSRQDLPDYEDGVSVSRLQTREDDPEPDPEPEPLPEDMGAMYQVDFDQPGIYSVNLTAFIDDQFQEWTTNVWVDEMPTQAPASPLLVSSVDEETEDGVQLLAWTAGEGEKAPFYNIVNNEGEVVNSILPVAELGTNGIVDFEYQVYLEPGEDPTYSVVAVNAVGETPATAVLTATEASYEHAFEVESVPAGRVLTLSGPSTPELDAIEAELLTVELAPSITGAYDSSFVSPSGTAFQVDMTAADADATVDDGWGIELRLGDSEDASGTPVWETMRDGFADELLAGGYVDLQLNGHPVRLKVAPSAETSQPGEFVIDAESAAPPGTLTDSFYAEPESELLDLGYAGEIDEDLLPLIGEANDPEFDWSTAVVSDIRTWIGDAEMMNDLELEVLSAGLGDEVEPGGIQVRLIGGVGGGGYEAMREFLENGAISFAVNAGAPNALALRVGAEDARTAYPAPVFPPSFVGATTVKFTQYRDATKWTPIVSWGSGEPGTIVVEGTLPEGLTVDWETGRIEGTPLEQGTFPIEVTVTNDAGETLREYSLVVGENSVDSEYQLTKKTRVQRNEDETASVEIRGLDWFRSDNPNVMTALPIISQLETEGDYINAPLDSITFSDPNGDPVLAIGTFSIEMYQGWGGRDMLRITSPDAVFGDNTTTTLADLFASGATITFVYDDGSPNTVVLGPADLYGT